MFRKFVKAFCMFWMIMILISFVGCVSFTTDVVNGDLPPEVEAVFDNTTDFLSDYSEFIGESFETMEQYNDYMEENPELFEQQMDLYKEMLEGLGGE